MQMRDYVVDRLEAARNWTDRLVADIGPDRWFEMPAAGVGHVAWQLGHLAVSQVALVHVRCFDKPVADCIDPDLVKTFGRGSTPVAQADAYPSAADIRALFDRTQREVIEMVRTMTDADLDAQAGTDPHPMFTTKAGAIGTAAIHEGFHAGQIAMMRRLWGKAPLR